MNLQERITVALLFALDSLMNIITFGAWEKTRGQRSSGVHVRDDNRQ